MYAIKLTGNIAAGSEAIGVLPPVSVILTPRYETHEEAEAVITRLEGAFPASSLNRDIVEVAA